MILPTSNNTMCSILKLNYVYFVTLCVICKRSDREKFVLQHDD